jgi:hypothetical protein
MGMELKASGFAAAKMTRLCMLWDEAVAKIRTQV